MLWTGPGFALRRQPLLSLKSSVDRTRAATSLVPGLANGVLLRTEVDHITGQLSDTRTRFLGTRPPKVSRHAVEACRAVEKG